MAGGAFSFAEVLRDEYVYLHGPVPRVRTNVEEKHLRELSHVARRVKAVPRAAAYEPEICRYSILKLFCQFRDPADDGRVITEAFRELLQQATIAVPDPNGKDRSEHLSLFEALLRDGANLSAQLRATDFLRKLVGVRGARRIVFLDRESALETGREAELYDVFCADSAAVRILGSDHRDLFRRFPPLLATIADDERLEKRLVGGDDAPQLRRRLLELFAETPRERRWYSWLWPFSNASTDEMRWRWASSAATVNALLDNEGPPAKPLDQQIAEEALTIFNSFLLETAFSDCFTDSYDVRAMNAACHDRDMAALCLSGGGIRSATFNLGILQGLADHGLLTKFHYLSTVSGGGYIGSWFSSWIRRHNEGLQGVANDLSAMPADPEDPEVRPIRHLRQYSSYLAPRAAFLSTDMWTLVATYFRNLLLNWTILIPALAAMLVLPRPIEAAAYRAWTDGAHIASVNAGYWAAGLAFLSVILVSLFRPRSEKKSGREKPPEALRGERMITRLWMPPLIAAAIAFCIFWPSLRAARDVAIVNGWLMAQLLAAGSALAGLVYSGRRIGAEVTGGNFFSRTWQFLKVAFRREYRWKTLGEIGAATASGFAAGALLRFVFARLFPPEALGEISSTLFFEQYICFGVPLFLLVFFAQATLLIGLTTIGTTDHDREWWARSAALMFVTAIYFLIVSVIVVLLPVLVAQSPEIIAPLGGVSAIMSWVLARSEKLKGRAQDETIKSKLMAVTLKVMAAVTVAVILAAIALASSVILANVGNLQPSIVAKILRWKALELAQLHLGVLQSASLRATLFFFGGAAAIAAIMSVFLDVNIYSMHSMYRARLIRAYLGASRWFRRPDPFTGFDSQDNVDMFELRADALWVSCIGDFRAFAVKLKAHALASQLPDTVQDRLNAYVIGPQPPPTDEIRSEVVRAINERMVTHDLQHNVPAPRSAAMFAANRRWLDDEFAGVISATSVPTAPAPRPPDTQVLAPARDDIAVPDDEQEHIYAELEAAMLHVTPERDRPPLHIINAALNLVGGDNLAWQERKADSFTISPLHAGNRRLGYRDSFDYGDHISLGTALAISGAAISPNMGYHSSSMVTFLMTLFNARLGWWLGNPSQSTYNAQGPRTTLESLFAEALGYTNDKSNWVFLSDGGHFDNLGVYEMVRRRCHYIVVCDATADGKYAFGDLGSAVRKIRVDLGIPITFRSAYIPPDAGQKVGRYCALGLIHYGDVDDVKNSRHRFGHLLYIKPAVYTECPADVRNYKSENTSFPHESTVDQFFGESQFESYRALGRHIVGQICSDHLDAPATAVPSVAAFVSWAKKYVDQHSAPAGNVPVKTMSDVVKWMQKSLGS